MMLYDDVYVPNGNYFEKLLQLTKLRLFFITFQKLDITFLPPPSPYLVSLAPHPNTLFSVRKIPPILQQNFKKKKKSFKNV
jgi:hypothetical protein